MTAQFMQWSKIKTRLRALVCDSLRDRVDFHLTTYRTHHNDFGGVCKCRDAHDLWITVDGLQVFRASYCKFEHERFLMWQAGIPFPDQEELMKLAHLQELHTPYDVLTALRSYLDLNPRAALQSQDPILRAMAILDRRIGSRTLKQLKVEDEEHSLVRMFYCLRCPDQRRETAPRHDARRQI